MFHFLDILYSFVNEYRHCAAKILLFAIFIYVA